MDTNFLTEDELQTVLDVLRMFNRKFSHAGSQSPVLMPSNLELFDSNGESVGTIEYEDGWYFKPAGAS